MVVTKRAKVKAELRGKGWKLVTEARIRRERRDPLLPGSEAAAHAESTILVGVAVAPLATGNWVFLLRIRTPRVPGSLRL